MARVLTLAIMVIAVVGVTAGAASAQGRPVGMTAGIGAGWDLPNDIDNINTASVRFRLPGGLTFEPLVVLALDKQSQELGGVDIESESTELTVATTARFPVASSGPMDLIVLGGAIVGLQSTDPEGMDNAVSTTTMAVVWGLAVEYWIASRWALSFNATNPLFSRVSTDDDGADSTTTNTGFGLIFDPNIVVMVHLFY